MKRLKLGKRGLLALSMLVAISIVDISFAGDTALGTISSQLTTDANHVADLGKELVRIFVALVLPVALLVGGGVLGFLHGKKKAESGHDKNPVVQITINSIIGIIGGAIAYGTILTAGDVLGFKISQIVGDFWR